MKKLLAMLLIAAALTGCEGDFTHTNVTITDKFIKSGDRPVLMIKLDDNGKEFVYRTHTEAYNIAEIGKKFNVKYKSFSDMARIEPLQK